MIPIKLPSPKIFIGYVCGITAAMFWGFHAVLIRYLVSQEVPAVGVAAFRLLTGSIILAVISTAVSAAKRKGTSIPFPYGIFFWMAVLGLAVNFLFFHVGLKYTIASDAILIEALAPVTVFALALFLLRERIAHLRAGFDSLRKILFIFIMATIGASLLLINDPKDILIQSDLKLRGDLWEFGAMLFFALFMVGSHEFQQRNPTVHPFRMTSRLFLFSGIMLVPFVPWSFLWTLTEIQWIWLLVLTVFSTVLNYSLWQIASKYLHILPMALLFSLSSVFTVIVESFVFNLEISLKFLIGGILILGASIYTQILDAKKEHEVTLYK